MHLLTVIALEQVLAHVTKVTSLLTPFSHFGSDVGQVSHHLVILATSVLIFAVEDKFDIARPISLQN